MNEASESPDPEDPSDPSELEETDVDIPEVSTNPDDNLSESVRIHYDNLAKRLFMFPSSLLREINELIDTNTIATGSKLRAIVRDRYKGTLKIPGNTTFRAYVVVRRRQKAILDKAKVALEDIPSELALKKPEGVEAASKSIYQDLTLSVENKKSLLENLIHLCERRISAINVLQENDPSASYEHVLGSYIREVRAITETLIKLRTELKSEGEKEIEIYINNKLSSVIRSTVQAYVSVHGNDKIELFRATLKLKLKDNKLDDLAVKA